MRGSPDRLQRRRRRRGSIPTSAGQPPRCASLRGPGWVYPHECGAAQIAFNGVEGGEGLSPRVRGSPFRFDSAVDSSRSIPTSAGQPHQPDKGTAALQVYPHECGAASEPAWKRRRTEGLSPRVRGSRRHRHTSECRPRSIPTSAGQPSPAGPTTTRCRVYPHECGAARISGITWHGTYGLSPRVRGSRRTPRRGPGRPGSIPTSAGQPPDDWQLVRWQSVYPHECGAAFREREYERPTPGLSPRVRGSHRRRRSRPNPLRSIPTSAGQPPSASGLGSLETVYPHECGAAGALMSILGIVTGLSPRVRGSRWRGGTSDGTTRSIPTSAGQPPTGNGASALFRVYPHECGAAAATLAGGRTDQGLSPRVRGSLKGLALVDILWRSIPTSAGQPMALPQSTTLRTVYPHECGAAGSFREVV